MNIKRIIICISIALLLINTTFLTKTFAFEEIMDAGEQFLADGEIIEEELEDGETGEVIDKEKLKEVNSKIYNILVLCGIIAAVIGGAALGIFFIIASPEGKAKVSQYLVPYIVGCVVVFGAFAIWKTTVEMGDEIIATEDATTCAGCGDELSEAKARAIEQGHRTRCGNCGYIYNN